MSNKTGRRRIVISIVVLAVASAVAWAIILASRPTSSDMAGMDHGSGAISKSTPSPTMPADMAGMDHGSEAMPESTPTPSMSEDMPGMDHGSGDAPESGHGDGDTLAAAPDRPLAPVLGTFGAGTSAVLITAGFLRRKDRAADRAKQAARAARKGQK